MSVTTIKIPAGQIDAVCASLRARRDDLEGETGASDRRLASIDSILRQIDAGSDGLPREITGDPAALCAAVYDALCGAAERLADECNELWRGTSGTGDARAGIAAVSAWLDLLESLGAPPVPAA